MGGKSTYSDKSPLINLIRAHWFVLSREIRFDLRGGSYIYSHGVIRMDLAVDASTLWLK